MHGVKNNSASLLMFLSEKRLKQFYNTQVQIYCNKVKETPKSVQKLFCDDADKWHDFIV